MTTPKFDKVSKQIILINLLTHAWKHWRNEPLWGLFADVCGVGSNTAQEICRELNLDPHAKINLTTIRNAQKSLTTSSNAPFSPPPFPDPKNNPNWDW